MDSGSWMGDRSGDGRKVEASDRWEVPVSISLAAGEIVLLNAAYDADGRGGAAVAWIHVLGQPIVGRRGRIGERPVDAAHGTAQTGGTC